MINGAKDFAKYASKVIKGFSCLYVVESKIMKESQDIETSPKIPETLKVHKILRTYNEHNVYEMELYELADETDPLLIQWYSKRATRVFFGTISFL